MMQLSELKHLAEAARSEGPGSAAADAFQRLVTPDAILAFVSDAEALNEKAAKNHSKYLQLAASAMRRIKFWQSIDFKSEHKDFSSLLSLAPEISSGSDKECRNLFEVLLTRLERRLTQASSDAGRKLHLNHPSLLPPVNCPLAINVGGEIVKARRTGFIENKERDMTYETQDGQLLVGRFQWTYP